MTDNLLNTHDLALEADWLSARWLGTNLYLNRTQKFQSKGFPGRGLTKDVSARDDKKSQGQDARSLVNPLPGKPVNLV